MGTKILDRIFDGFTRQLKVITSSGSIIEATFADVPRQRNSRAENKTIKEGGVHEGWEQEENQHKRRQKDTDAQWAKKNKEVPDGYKKHVKADKKYGLYPVW